MVINWYGEGCFKVQTGGLTLLSDPFENSIGLTPPRGKTDLVIKTLTPYPLPEKENDEQIILGEGKYEVKGVEVDGFEVVKESTDKFFKTVYVVKAEDLKLCFLGHISEYPEPDILENLKNIDILFVPSGGKPFLNVETAAKLIKQIEPKIAVASFFKTPGLKRSSEDYKELAKEIGQKTEPEEKLTIRKKEASEIKGIKLVALKI